MKVWKKIFAVLLIVVLLAGMVAIHLLRKDRENQMALGVQNTQEEIQTLETEKLELEKKLTHLEDGNAADDEESEAEVQEGPFQTVLCVTNVTETFYQEIFPTMEEKGQTGILILRNGRLPGDETDDIISAESFVAMMDAGWRCGITVTDYDGDTLEDWEQAIDTYVDELEMRVSVAPSVYCFENKVAQEWLDLLADKGYEAVLTHDALENEEMKVIQLLPYDSGALTEDLSQMEGYCGLELWASWEEDTDEALQYSQDNTLELLDSGDIELTGLENLEALTPAKKSDEDSVQLHLEKYTTKEQIEKRIAAIETEIEQLYQS